MIRPLALSSAVLAALLLCQCAGPLGTGNMGGPTEDGRKAEIAAEPKGDYFVGRRYYVQKTRFWGYVRRPRESWNRAQLVLMREDKKRTPDRLPENGSPAYGYDQNYEYKLRGYFTGKKAYDPNSNQILPEFMLTGYEVRNRQPGWLFRPDDRYDSTRITLYPR
ncbi:hypothetical protein [Haloferula sargassicola]|uniref:Uncharacterized protein n=1 Tax=Haloferula sargassicola TaxID=490096 RepID=A0ABP9UUD1_9BACT